MERTLTDEQLVLYADAAQERLTSQRKAEFQMMVEAVRAGNIFSRDDRQFRRWSRTVDSGRSKGLTGQALENAIAALRSSHPEYVSVEVKS